MYEPMKVSRGEERLPRGGVMSTVDPPMDPLWDKTKKLVWHAAVAEYDTGIFIRIGPGEARVNGHRLPDMFSVQVGQRSVVLDYEDAWTYINGVHAGWDAHDCYDY